jgi:hypothetical protein
VRVDTQAHGWAAVQDGYIDLRTVYGTRRGAIVNWLATNNVYVTSSMTDDHIERLWSIARGKSRTLNVIEVTVSGRAGA